MVVCLMRISKKSRNLIGISNSILIASLVFLQVFVVLLKTDKVLEFHSIGVFGYFWKDDPVFIWSIFISGILLLFSVFLLVFVFDVAVSQESEHFHVNPRGYSSSIYLLLVSLVLCVLSFSLSIRVATEFDHKMTQLLMDSYSKYGKSKESRSLVDRIHIEFSCCGVNSIDDLVDLSEIDKSLAPQTKLWECKDWEYCGVPLSCCKSTSCSQKTTLLVDGWDPDTIMEKWFNKRGCVSEMDNSFLFFGFPEHIISDFVMVLVIGFHLCALVLTQILVTSSATFHGAKLEKSESSYAWLFDIGMPDSKALLKELNPDLPPSYREVSNSNNNKSEAPSQTEKETTHRGILSIVEKQTDLASNKFSDTTASSNVEKDVVTNIKTEKESKKEVTNIKTEKESGAQLVESSSSDHILHAKADASQNPSDDSTDKEPNKNRKNAKNPSKGKDKTKTSEEKKKAKNVKGSQKKKKTKTKSSSNESKRKGNAKGKKAAPKKSASKEKKKSTAKPKKK